MENNIIIKLLFDQYFKEEIINENNFHDIVIANRHPIKGNVIFINSNTGWIIIAIE